jgi:hypothetical protein
VDDLHLHSVNAAVDEDVEVAHAACVTLVRTVL